MTHNIKTCSSLFRLLNWLSSPVSRPHPTSTPLKSEPGKHIASGRCEDTGAQFHQAGQADKRLPPAPTRRAGGLLIGPHRPCRSRGSGGAEIQEVQLSPHPHPLPSVRVRTRAAACWARGRVRVKASPRRPGEKFVIRVGLSRPELDNNCTETRRRGWGSPRSQSPSPTPAASQSKEALSPRINREFAPRLHHRSILDSSAAPPPSAAKKEIRMASLPLLCSQLGAAPAAPRLG